MADPDIEKIVSRVLEKMAGAKPSADVDLKPDTTTRQVPLNLRDDVKRVAIGSDKSSADVRKIVAQYLESAGYRVVHVCAEAGDGTTFVDTAVAVARKVASGECERGIMFDPDGIASAMACNKVKGVRAALCYDMRSVVNSREHVNANVMTLGGPIHNEAELCEMSRVWLELRFPGGKYWPNVNSIMSIERA